MKKVLILFLLLTVPGLSAADDTRILEFFKCKLKEGKTMAEVKETNVRWLANTRKTAGTDDINSFELRPQVGEFGYFLFIDSYPDLATWAKADAAENTEEGKAIEKSFGELLDCEKNRLYKSTKD